ncbi:hypothetical protein ABKP09_19985 [Peribacillus frigoritolerans]|uniref:hypothetical protein n=1 Tax=Peribacillus frigoritolerans TaxID=450367 RepID=UPI0032B3C12C
MKMENKQSVNQNKAKRQAIIALESEVSEFCKKVEELGNQYGFKLTTSHPYAGVMVSIKGTNTSIGWLGNDDDD